MYRVVGAVAVCAALAALVVPATAHAYWDFQGYLYNPCCPIQYAESNPTYDGNNGYWQIRLSRSNCSAKLQIHYVVGYWEQEYVGCYVSDVQWSYGVVTHDASRGINLDSGTTVWTNIRIDAYL